MIQTRQRRRVRQQVRGHVTPGTWTTPTKLSATAWGESVTIGVGTLLWDDGSIWSEDLHLDGTQNGSGTAAISAAPTTLYDVDYVNGSGNPVHLVQTGASQVVLIFANQVMGVGTFFSPTQLTCPAAPNDIATVSNDFTTVTWQDGTVWTETAPTAAITVTNYTNQFGVAAHLIQNGSNQLAFIDSLGRVSLGVMTGPNTALADLYPGDVATIGIDTVSWQDGFVWTKTSGAPPLTTTFVDVHGAFSHVELTSATTLLGLDGPLQAVIGTRVNNEIDWSNGDVWADFDYDALNALFEMATGYP